MDDVLKTFPQVLSTQPPPLVARRDVSFHLVFWGWAQSMEHRRVCNRWRRDIPLLAFCSTSTAAAPHLLLHQEETELLGYALRDDLIRSSTQRLCLCCFEWGLGDLVACRRSLETDLPLLTSVSLGFLVVQVRDKCSLVDNTEGFRS